MDGIELAGIKLNPYIIKTGTGSLIFFGAPTVIDMVTSIAGQAELSTFPTNCFSMTGRQGTKVNWCECSTSAYLPLTSCTDCR